MTDVTTKTALPIIIIGTISNILYRGTKSIETAVNKTVCEVENVVASTVKLTNDVVVEPAAEIVEDIEVFFHKEKTYGFVFLFIVIIILGYKLKNE